jgi:hypothetical protein
MAGVLASSTVISALAVTLGELIKRVMEGAEACPPSTGAEGSGDVFLALLTVAGCVCEV